MGRVETLWVSADAVARQRRDPEAVMELDRLADDWQLALDGASSALDAAVKTFSGDELRARRHSLALERAEAARELAELAADVHSPHIPWLAPSAVQPQSLGLGSGIRACVFDLDGVLTDSGVLHAAAWSEVFDDLLLRLAEDAGWQFVPFDADADYRAYIDGRPRLEGIHTFLRSRGIRLSEGHPEDPVDVDTAYGIAHRKSRALARGLSRRGVNAVPGARRYLEAAGRAGLGRAVVSCSTRTLPMLELADIASLVDVRVDAEHIETERLGSRPAPDILLSACRGLRVEPAAAVTFAHNPDGVAAGRAAGMAVIGVGSDERLLAFGAERLVGDLTELLDRRLLAAA